MSNTVDYRSLSPEDLDRMERAVDAAMAILTDSSGEMKQNIQAPEERAAKTLVQLSEKRMLIAQIRHEREERESKVDELERKIKTLERERRRLKKNNKQLKESVTVLQVEVSRLKGLEDEHGFSADRAHVAHHKEAV